MEYLNVRLHTCVVHGKSGSLQRLELLLMSEACTSVLLQCELVG